MELSLSNGNEELKARLDRQLKGRGLSHAYILTGPEGAERQAIAEFLCKAYVCTSIESPPCGTCSGCRKIVEGIHPDLIVVGAEGETINVAAARTIKTTAYIRPNEAPRKVFLFPDAQELTSQVQDVLLKLLEESPPYAAFLLLTENERALLPTIRSRCELLRLVSPPEQTGEDGSDDARNLARLLCSGEELQLMEWALALEKWDKDELAALFDGAVFVLANKLIKENGGQEKRRLLMLITHLKALRLACDYNVGTGHLAGWLAAGAQAKI
jgi:DNA polymerase-3 subunit delta'